MSQSPSRLHLRWAILVLIVAVLALFYIVNPTTSLFIPKCPFKLITGWQCAGCGFQRALHAVLHGHIAEAISYNLFLIYSLPYFLLILFTEYVARGTLKVRFRQWFESKIAIYLYVTLFCMWTVVRNVCEM